MVERIQGKAYWAKVLKSPVPAYDPAEKHWTIDVVPNAKSLSKLQTLGLEDKLKPDLKSTHEGGKWINFSRRELKRGTEIKNKPINVIGTDGTLWDQDELIGNGSEVEVAFNVYDIPARGRFKASKGVAVLDIKILKHVHYVKKEKSGYAVASEAEEAAKRNPKVDSGNEKEWV